MYNMYIHIGHNGFFVPLVCYVVANSMMSKPVNIRVVIYYDKQVGTLITIPMQSGVG